MTKLISTEEAATILGITRQSMAWLLRNGRVKAQKVGRSWVVEKDSLLEYKKEREQRLAERGEANEEQ